MRKSKWPKLTLTVLGVCKGGSPYPKYPNFRGPISQFQRFDIQISQFYWLQSVRIMRPLSYYPKFHMDIPISQFQRSDIPISQKKYPYPNIPNWLTPPYVCVVLWSVGIKVTQQACVFLINLTYSRCSCFGSIKLIKLKFSSGLSQIIV